MSQFVLCGSCQRKLHIRPELAGKSIRCPGCGTVIPASAATRAPAPSVAPAARAPAPVAAPGPDRDDRERPRKRKKRRGKRSSSAEAQPLFMLGDMEMTPVKCLVFGGAFLGLVAMVVLLFVFTPLGSIFSTEPEASFVDVYTAVNSVRYTDLVEYSLQLPGTTTYIVPGHRKIIVSRDNPAGEFVLVHVKIPQKEVDSHFQGVRTEFVLNSNNIELQGDSGRVGALFAQDRSNEPATGYHLAYMPPLRGGGQALRVSISPRAEDWTHPGDLKEDANKLLEFAGKNGMRVKTEISERRFDESARRLGGRGGSSRVEGMVEAWMRVTWDPQSTGWIIADEHPQPNTISRTWDVSCFFPRPKNAGKEMTIYIFGKPRTVPVK